MDRAAASVGRAPEEVALVAVSKTFPVEAVRLAAQAGQIDFGENRVQEALPKIDALGVAGVRWHLIGHLQSNKANAVVGRFALIHSVDSVHLIQALEKRAAALGVRQAILFQVNVSGEASKSGAAPGELPGLVDAMAAAPHLECQGLMTIPPWDADAEAARPHFARLRELLATLPTTDNIHPRHLSMGMSGDFEAAIAEGATLARVGSAIFGRRG
jgi:pyridoxal phosphate enzyme (YggS family)